MRKFSIILMLAVLLSGITASAQDTPLKDLLSKLPRDPGVEMVRGAVDSAVLLLRQDYTLEGRNGMQYGRSKNAFFGRRYAIGVLTTSGVYTVNDLLIPWKTDANFDKYRSADTLRPHLSHTQYMRAGDNRFHTLGPAVSIRSNDSLVTVLALPDSVRAMPNAAGKPDTTGWLVMMNAGLNKGSVDTAAIRLDIIKPRISLSASNGKLRLHYLVTKEAPLGGIYFTTKSSLGKVAFFAAGILMKDKEGWFIQLFNAADAVKGVQKQLEDAEKLSPTTIPGEEKENQSEQDF